MAKTKAELLAEAKALKLEVTSKNTVAEITEAIKAADVDTAAEPAREAKVAKAGKRSAKGLEEAEAKVEKIEHQKHRDEASAEEESKPKRPVKPTRSRLERRGKNFRKASEQVDKNKSYEPQRSPGTGSQDQPDEIRCNRGAAR